MYFFRRLIDSFGLPFLGFLALSQYVYKGAVMTLSMRSMLPLLKSMDVQAVSYQVYMTVVMVPWSFKPLVGLLSDLIRIKGYHKRWWLVIAMVLGTMGAILTFVAYASMTLWLLLASLFLIQCAVSVTDLLTEGKYSELMREHPETGSDLVTLVNGFQTLGAVTVMFFLGSLADNKMWNVLFAMVLVLMTTPIVPTILGWLPETRILDSRWVALDWKKLTTDKPMIFVVGFAGLAGPLVAGIATLGQAGRIAAVCVAAIMLCVSLVGAFVAFPRLVALVATYQTLVALSKPSMGGALDYWYTADNTCWPDSPHFDWAYYLTYTGLIGALVSFATVWLYQAWMSRWRFRTVLITTTLMVSAGGLFDLAMVLRFNTNYLGIPDKIFYVAGDAILETVAQMLYWIPSSAIISKVVPDGMEASCYALLAGMANFSRMVSSLSGAMIFHAAGIQTKPIENGFCAFQNLWWLILLFHVFLPIIVGVPATLLVPNCFQTDRLDDNGLVQERVVEALDSTWDTIELTDYVLPEDFQQQEEEEEEDDDDDDDDYI